MNKKVLTIIAVASFILSLPVTASALSVGWDRYVSGSGGAIRELYNSGTDHVLIGGTATTTSAQLEVQGNIVTTKLAATTSISNLGGILDVSNQSGAVANIGSVINTAYAGASSIGTNMFIPAPTSGNTWQFSTGISASTSGKPMLLTCAFGGSSANYGTNGATLRYTGTTGTSTTFDTNSAIIGGASGVRNCDLQGTNGTTARITDGVYFGGNDNGAFSASVEDSDVSGFGQGVVFRPNTSFNSIVSSNIHFNGRNLSEPDTSGANCENMRILNSVIADANWQSGGGHPTDWQGFYVQESGNCQWSISQTSLDDNQTYEDQFGGTANIWSWLADHQEDPNGHSYTTIQTNIGSTNVINSLIGGDIMADIGNEPDQIEAAGQVNLLGFTSDVNNNINVAPTRIINALASSTVITWAGLACKDNGAPLSMVYGQVPCSPMGVGSDYGAPSFYVASSSTNGIGSVGIATSSPSSAFGNAVLNLGVDSVNAISNSASTTVVMTGKLQVEGKNAAGTVVCLQVVGITPTVTSGTCTK